MSSRWTGQLNNQALKWWFLPKEILGVKIYQKLFNGKKAEALKLGKGSSIYDSLDWAISGRKKSYKYDKTII